MAKTSTDLLRDEIRNTPSLEGAPALWLTVLYDAIEESKADQSVSWFIESHESLFSVAAEVLGFREPEYLRNSIIARIKKKKGNGHEKR